jgi:hypothetical protein
MSRFNISFNLRIKIKFLLYLLDGLETVLAKINVNQMPVDTDHLNVHPKHNVISLMMPQVTIQLIAYASIIMIITAIIANLLSDMLSFNLLTSSPFN